MPLLEYNLTHAADESGKYTVVSVKSNVMVVYKGMQYNKIRQIPQFVIAQVR